MTEESQSPEGADCAAELRVIGDALLAAHDHLEMHKLERTHCNSVAAIRAGLAAYSACKKRPDMAAPAPAEGDAPCATDWSTKNFPAVQEAARAARGQMGYYKEMMGQARANVQPKRTVAVPAGMVRSDAELWLRKRGQIIDALRAEGLTIVTTVHGVHLMRLGKIEAQAASPAPAVGADDVRDAARYRWLKSLPGSSPNLRGMAIDGARTLKNRFSTPHAVYVAESIDGAIDAAMGTAKPPVQHNGGANG